MPRKPTLIFALIAGLSAGACAEEHDEKLEHEEHEEECTQAQLMRIDTILEMEADELAGAEVFADTCAASSCHGPDGVSGTGPPLSEEVPEHEVHELGCVLLLGPGEMPSLDTLGDQELADVIAYVSATF